MRYKIGSCLGIALVLPLVLLGCAQSPAPTPANAAAAPSSTTRGADEQAVKVAAEGREKAIAARDIDRILSFYEPSGWQLGAEGPIAKSEAERRQFWEGVQKLPIATLMVDVDSDTLVSRSGDLAVRYGTFRQTLTDKQGNPKSTVQKNMNVWRKQADGSWKIVASISTAPN